MNCNHCGKCCFFPSGDKTPEGLLILQKCKNLVFKDGKSTCRIYGSRLGKHIGTSKEGIKYFCVMYNSLNEEIEGCPLNIDLKKPKKTVIIDGKSATSSTI